MTSLKSVSLAQAQEFVAFIVSVATFIQKAFEDGKLDFSDLWGPSVFDIIGKAEKGVDGIQLIPSELENAANQDIFLMTEQTLEAISFKNDRTKRAVTAGVHSLLFGIAAIRRFTPVNTVSAGEITAESLGKIIQIELKKKAS